MVSIKKVLPVVILTGHIVMYCVMLTHCVTNKTPCGTCTSPHGPVHSTNISKTVIYAIREYQDATALYGFAYLDDSHIRKIVLETRYRCFDCKEAPGRQSTEK